ncbi:nuclear envelope pore membrane protein POM 121 [Lampris incognitus]|uniref:nuclear envelope pore membrane protein POM 121 n=1 Tax=Lampris incognitus TaxID=2546036 RepID=UPI0024B5FF7E|nr:nuclear envelope pore membrane protein POM 121 [Lampris incognitus]
MVELIIENILSTNGERQHSSDACSLHKILREEENELASWDIKVIRRRVAAMSPREKRFILHVSLVFFAIVIFCLALYYIPTFLYVALILAVCCSVCYCHNEDSLYARLGLNPRSGLTIPPVFRRWLTGRTAIGVTSFAPGRPRSRAVKADDRESDLYSRQRLSNTDIYRRESLGRESFFFSPRNIHMGSYIGKPESPAGIVERPNTGRVAMVNPNPPVHLRERVSRPSQAGYTHTPTRKLSFSAESLGTTGRFTITPQRHYPLQQSGTSKVGVLPPVQWDSFKKKNILSPRNALAHHSLVTIKIARPDHSTPRSPLVDCLSSPGGLGSPSQETPADPCSRDTILKVLKESRKREVEVDDDGSFTAEQKKRRRSDSGGSAQSAFEPLLPNGVPSQLVPMPGTLKRGVTSVAEETTIKRSRTSSISSGSFGQVPSGTLGSARNPISSSYSSSRSFGQKKRASEHSSPLSSPGSSRSQTPERASKKKREDDLQSPSSASSARSDKTSMDPAPVNSKVIPDPKVPLAASLDSAASRGGVRMRKIQLVTSNRTDEILLPPPLELGYTITAEDIDLEKIAVLSQIKKIFEEPTPEPDKPGPSLDRTTSSSQVTSSVDSTTTLSSLLAAPLPIVSTPASVAAPIPVINLDPSPASSVSTLPSATTMPASNPLLEALKMKSNTLSSTASVVTTMAASIASMEPSGQTLKPSSTEDAPQQTPASLSQSTSTGQSQPSGSVPSAFTQVLGQTTKAPSSAPIVAGASLFGLASQLTAPAVSSISTIPATSVASATSTESAGSANPLLASGFKPIFAATTTSSAMSGPENKPAVPTFKPIFGSATTDSGFGKPQSFTTASTSVPTASSTNTSSVFGGLTNSSTSASAPFTGLSNIIAATAAITSTTTTTDPAALPAGKSLFANWGTSSTTSTTLASGLAPTTGSTFQFGPAATTTLAAVAPSAAPTNSASSTFTFGAMTTMSTTTQPAPQTNTQKVFSFGQAASNQNPSTASFGGFGLTNTIATTTSAAPVTQASFAFGKSSFEPSAAPSAFPSSTAAPVKPFTFGASGTVATSASAPTPTPFTFGGAATTTASTFGTSAKPAFGANSTGFAFGNTMAPSAAPSFGVATQSQSAPTSTFTFGSTAPQQAHTVPAQQTSGGFNFGAAISGAQFGTPISNNSAPQMASFNFGSATDKPTFGTSTPSFGQSAVAGPIPFGSPGTPVQGFNSVASSPFGSSATPSFSIGAGSKPSGARQRLQARRQHTRKK